MIITPETVAMANKRLVRLNAHLVNLERSPIGRYSREELGKKIRLTRVAIQRWEDILACPAMKWEQLYSMLTAHEALYVVDHTRPRLNDRGQRVLAYLRKRRARIW